MKYLAATSSSLEGAHPDIHVMIGPRQGGVRPLHEGRLWGADNDAFHNRFDMDAFAAHLGRLEPFAAQQLFVAMPDFVHDPDSTLACWRACMRDFAERFPLFRFAFVAQTGCEPDDIPDDAQALFLAGLDAWREGPAGRDLIQEAKERGLHVHVGRVNSARRMKVFARMGADTCDGTHLRFTGVEKGLIEIGRWLDAVHAPPPRRQTSATRQILNSLFRTHGGPL